MYSDWHYARLHDREARERELAERMEERRGDALASARGPSLRASVARGLFQLAVAVERRETWRVVWERLEARGRL